MSPGYYDFVGQAHGPMSLTFPMTGRGAVFVGQEIDSVEQAAGPGGTRADQGVPPTNLGEISDVGKSK